jgi:predicted N-formylglutamate amidohydrolase
MQPSMTDAAETLLAAGDQEPVSIYNPSGTSPLVLVADHAGNRLPRALGTLGLPQAELERHIAWDIGIAGVAHLLADALDAVLIRQNYSRLVVDCNRPPGSPASMPEVSELTAIPGNAGLSEAARAAREGEIFWPYHRTIERELDRRQQANRPAALIALHSFTPVFKGVTRGMHAAVLYHRNPRFPRELLSLLRQQRDLIVGDNEPYFVSDATDFTIPVHGERRNLPHVLMEIRQDLIAGEPGQQQWAALLARLLPEAYRRTAT